MDIQKAKELVDRKFDQSAEKALADFISIPNQSPLFDPEWETNGLLEKAANHLITWVKGENVPGLTIELLQEKGYSPLIYINIEGVGNADNRPVLMYGHLDKQPPLDPQTWDEGLHPHKPVFKDGKLYGRGGCDDGYAIFSAIVAIEAIKEQNLPHSRIVIIIEGSEESGSKHLPFYMEKLSERLDTPSMIVCLDSGCGTYDRFWVTSSLRGCFVGDLTVKILREGCHSGHASGIVPSSFRIIRQLLDRIECSKTGQILVPELYAEISEEEIKQSEESSLAIGADIIVGEFPWVKNAHPDINDVAELVRRRTLKPAISYVGADGFPTLQAAGNVLRTHTSIMMSIRVPPSVDPASAAAALKKVLEANPPNDAEVKFTVHKTSPGWTAPSTSSWLKSAMETSSNKIFNQPHAYLGVGGSIPFMNMLKDKYPNAQALITGVGGPASNAHGPNEMINLGYCRKLTAIVAYCVHAEAQNH